MSRRAVHPMSQSAGSAADDDFYSTHPELVQDGKRQPIDPHDPKQAGLQHEWMQAYAKNGGMTRQVSSKAQAQLVRQAAQDSAALPSNVGTAAPIAPCPNQPTPLPQISAIASAPKPDKPPQPCSLVKATHTCQHGRQSQNGVLSVVPTNGALGDKIACAAQAVGGCGDHVEWSIGGAWTSTEKGSSTSFSANTIKPSMTGWVRLYKVEPQIYRVNASACEGGAPSVEIRSYPPDTVEFKLNFENLKKAIDAGFKLAPLSEEDKKKCKFAEISLALKQQWKEDKASARAFCELQVQGGADPLFETPPLEFPLYPPAAIPEALQDYLKLGVFFDITAELSLTVSFLGQYWPDTTRWKFDHFEGEFEGKVEFKLFAEMLLVSKDAIKVEIAGVTSFVAKAKPASDEPAIKAEFLWGGLTANITVQAAWDFISYEKTYQLFAEQLIAEHEFPLDDNDSESGEE